MTGAENLSIKKHIPHSDFKMKWLTFAFALNVPGLICAWFMSEFMHSKTRSFCAKKVSSFGKKLKNKNNCISAQQDTWFEESSM